MERKKDATLALVGTRRKKTTMYLDEDLLRRAKVLAARTGRRDYEVMEEALRRYLGLGVIAAVWERSDLEEEEALRLAYRELHSSRG
jgi:predicted transcriptional regulator